MIIQRLSIVFFALLLAACSDTATNSDGNSDSNGQANEDSANMSDSGAQAEIEKALDWLEGNGPRLATAIASGQNVVRSVLLDHPQVKVLTDHPKRSVTGVLLRRANLGEKAKPITRIAWYLILEQSKDPRGVTILLDDLAALKDEGSAYVNSPGYPFRYAIDALRALRPDVKLEGDWEVLFRERKQLSDRY